MFTQNLAAATGGREIVALHPPDQAAPYPLEVHHRIRRDERADYAHTARALDRCADVVSIQYADGIWGGEDGDHVLDFVRALRVPAIATLHSIPGDPTPSQRAILAELVAATAATVVMSRSAKALLAGAYGIDPLRVAIIPHGVPNLPLVDPETMKPTLGLAGREIILGFGLLRPGKGYELVLDALPEVVAAHPTALFVIVGMTHPSLLPSEGETYRQRLQAQARALGMEGHVQFVDRFVGRVELIRWLEAADVFVTPYRDLDQVVSGTLAYALAAGRAIVSTPFAAAGELLADGRGMLVPAGSAKGLATAVNDLLGDRPLRASIGRLAHEHSREMAWPAVGVAYRRLFDEVTTNARPVPLVTLAQGRFATGAAQRLVDPRP